VLTLTDLVVDVDESDDYGGTKICDLPDSNLMLLGAEVDLELVKGEESGGLEAATDMKVGIGTAVASAQPIATSMQNVIELDDLTASDASPAWVAHSNDQSTIPMPLKVADGASNALYLNVSALITATDTLTASGTVTLFYVDLGNVTS
jgi:hypothetical protein